MITQFSRYLDKVVFQKDWDEFKGLSKDIMLGFVNIHFKIKGYLDGYLINRKEKRKGSLQMPNKNRERCLKSQWGIVETFSQHKLNLLYSSPLVSTEDPKFTMTPQGILGCDTKKEWLTNSPIIPMTFLPLFAALLMMPPVLLELCWLQSFNLLR